MASAKGASCLGHWPSHARVQGAARLRGQSSRRCEAKGLRSSKVRAVETVITESARDLEHPVDAPIVDEAADLLDALAFLKDDRLRRPYFGLADDTTSRVQTRPTQVLYRMMYIATCNHLRARGAWCVVHGAWCMVRGACC